jgi:hypothetical protein
VSEPSVRRLLSHVDLRVRDRIREGPEDIYGYYAVFFEDPDGNKLEVCYVTS